MLLGALPHVRPAMSINQLRNEVKIGSQTPYIISVSATAKDRCRCGGNCQCRRRELYPLYRLREQSGRRGSGPAASAGDQLLQGSSPLKPTRHLCVLALVGAIFGALIGVVIALAISRSDRRLRERDEIANSIGVPVLASFPVGHPSNPGEWTRLLEDYKPGALHALQLRKALQQLEMAAAEANFGSGNDRWSFTVLSLSSDPGALALGPQLAIFAASQGIPTALVIGPQQDATVTATLRTACAAPPTSSKWPGHLQVIVSDGDVEVPAGRHAGSGRGGRRWPEPASA